MTFLAPLFGALALTLCVGSYLLRSHRSLTLTGAAGVACWALHFAAKGVWTPCVLSALMAVRVAAGVVVIDLSPRAKWLLTFLAWGLTGAGACLTWQGVVSLPSTIATVWLAFAGFHLRYKALRWALLAGEVLWFTNGWVSGSGLAMFAAVLSVVLNLAIIGREHLASRTV